MCHSRRWDFTRFGVLSNHSLLVTKSHPVNTRRVCTRVAVLGVCVCIFPVTCCLKGILYNKLNISAGFLLISKDFSFL